MGWKKQKKIQKKIEDAYVVLKNINKLSTNEIEQYKSADGDIDFIEDSIISRYSKEAKSEYKDIEFIKELMKTLSLEKNEGETNSDFEEKLSTNCIKLLKLDYVIKKD